MQRFMVQAHVLERANSTSQAEERNNIKRKRMSVNSWLVIIGASEQLLREVSVVGTRPRPEL